MANESITQLLDRLRNQPKPINKPKPASRVRIKTRKIEPQDLSRYCVENWEAK